MPNVTMPRLSDSMVDGTIVSWLRAEGDEIKVGDEIVEIETDKAIMPYQAEDAGPLQIVAKEGDVISVGAVIGYIGEPDSTPAASVSAAPHAQPQAASATTAVLTAPAQANGSSPRIKASPVAKRLAAALGVDLTQLTGSGPDGRIVKRDVEGAGPAGPAPAPTTLAPGAVEHRPLTPTQATIARRMVEAKAIPDFTVTMVVDMHKALALRSELKQTGAESVPSLGDFVIKACALALREHPQINASFGDGELLIFSQINIGVAVAAPGSLLVPTVFDADSKSLGQIAAQTRRLAQRGRNGELTPAEMTNATFTVSNLGMFGVSHFTAVLNPPQAAILAVGGVEQQLVLRDGEVLAGQRMSMTLTSDHRVIYGADAAAFLASVRDGLEAPLKLFI